MRRILVVVLLTTGFCLSAPAQKKVIKDGSEFDALIKRYYTAWSTLNPDNAAPLYAKDVDLVFYDIAPLKYGGWQEYSDMFKKSMAPGFSSLTLTPNNDVKVKRSGNLAVTTLTFRLSAKQKDGAPVEFDGRHTIVWEKRGGHWLIIHEHVSKPI